MRSKGRLDTLACGFEQSLHTKEGEAKLNYAETSRRQMFETEIIERYRRRKFSVEEALMQIGLACISVRCVEDITNVLWGTRGESRHPIHIDQEDPCKA
ncbi:transposase [Roseibium album]|uniref:transposase n=1 Tax=Roseibium album TaxID=311410 RepID=UPI0032EEBAC3